MGIIAKKHPCHVVNRPCLSQVWVTGWDPNYRCVTKAKIKKDMSYRGVEDYDVGVTEWRPQKVERI